MTISILGPGNMGKALASIWSKKGYKIIFSHSKNEEKINQLLNVVAGSTAETIVNAIKLADVIVLTTQYAGLQELYQYKDHFENKMVFSCVSNLTPDFSGNTIGLPTNRKISVAEEIQENLSKALVCEAFNSAFAVNIENLERLKGNELGSIFYCTDHQDIKKTAQQLISDLDYTPIDAGVLKNARTLETFATVWVQMAVVANKYPGYGLKIINQ